MVSNISTLFFKDYRRLVLELLLLQPDKQYHVREIARLTGTVAGTLHKELARLAEAGVLLKVVVGNQVQYRANTECFVFEELQSLLKKLVNCNEKVSRTKQTKMNAMVEKYRSQILLLAKRNGIDNVRVFGSMARNEDGPDSDLDLLVDIQKGQSGFALGGFLTDVSELVHRKVDVVTEKSLPPGIRDKVLQEAIAL